MLKKIAIFSAFCVILPVHAASFDCKKAQAEIEQTICNDKDLSALDSQLGKTYNSLLKILAKKEASFLRQTQRYWAQTRENNCDIHNAACLAALYRQRLTTLDFFKSPDYLETPTGRASGIYQLGGNMEMVVEALSAQELAVNISGAEPTNGRWICDFGGQGTLENGVLAMKALDDAIVKVTFAKNQATVDEGEESLFCGMGGSLNGKYQKQ
ncbi:hypothetical protein BegalDRAFT_1083 [Beggiatoa alba B18LD]|uniref:Lysozyme inhibitor LprI-like N-terminal domain-containing protein n=1 Tax=Beggiatoa alba B18LD TaxID=395493 RepID=I3CEE3_9GAMM|nr:lysozyme inhibitor LprI family protein [Beggiatoa alba]EIJ41986.1 hypothetical protein BegalDRAFT_1083 [Beggiatoa alba B18LD]